MEMVTLKLNKKTAFIAVLCLIVGCSSVKPRKPQFAVVKEIKIVDKKDSVHVGIFVPDLKEKKVRYNYVKDDTDASKPPTIIITLKNADVAKTPIPKGKKEIGSSAIHEITTRYEDIEDTTRGYIKIALTNDYPYYFSEKPFGYELKIVKDKPPLKAFEDTTEEKTPPVAEEEKKTGEPKETVTSEKPEEPETIIEEPEVKIPVVEKAPITNILSAEFAEGNKLILETSQPVENPTLNLVGSEDYLLRLPKTNVDENALKKIRSIKGKYPDLIQQIETSVSGESVVIRLKVKKEVYPILQKSEKQVLIKFEKFLPPLDDFGSYLKLKKEIATQEITLNLKNALTYDALNLLASFTDVNFIIDENLTDRMTLHLKNVPWDSAFVSLLQSQRLGFVREKSSIIRIAKLSTLLEEKKLAQQAREALDELEEKEAVAFPLSYIEAAKLQGNIKGLLSKEGNLMVDKTSNTLLVYDYPSKLKKIYTLLQNADQKRAQIRFETEIIEAPVNFHKEIQSYWSESTNSGINVSQDEHTFQGNIKDKEQLKTALSEAETSKKITRISIPALITLDRYPTSISAGITQDKKKTTFKLSVLPRIVENQDIYIDVQFEKEHPLSEKDEIFINTKTHLLIENGNTAMIGGFTTANKEFLILITPSIGNI